VTLVTLAIFVTFVTLVTLVTLETLGINIIEDKARPRQATTSTTPQTHVRVVEPGTDMRFGEIQP
jgi:hypothetical protein